jgi:hypothetical protein
MTTTVSVEARLCLSRIKGDVPLLCWSYRCHQLRPYSDTVEVKKPLLVYWHVVKKQYLGKRDSAPNAFTAIESCAIHVWSGENTVS